MNGGALPFVLIYTAFGLALTKADPGKAWRSVALLALTALLLSLTPVPPSWGDTVLLGFWLSMILTAGLVLASREMAQPLAIEVAITNGAFAGLLASMSDMRAALIFALPLSLLFVGGRWLIRRGYGIVPKVLSSWLIAVGALAMFVSLVPTPGYELDHME